MTYDELDYKLKVLRLKKSEFADIVGFQYKTITNWKQVPEIPSWVSSWLENYEAKLKLEQIAQLLKGVI